MLWKHWIINFLKSLVLARRCCKFIVPFQPIILIYDLNWIFFSKDRYWCDQFTGLNAMWEIQASLLSSSFFSFFLSSFFLSSFFLSLSLPVQHPISFSPTLSLFVVHHSTSPPPPFTPPPPPWREQKAIPSIYGRVSRNSCLSSAISTSLEEKTLWLYFE